MPPDEVEEPLGSIESAQAFMDILADTIVEAMKDLSQHQRLAVREGEERRARAIELALFKLRTLCCYVHKSRRALNDLRMLRRLILNERATVESVLATL